MDVNQIGIKINQTQMSNEVNSKLNIKNKSSMINFDQILSMFSLLGQSPELNDKEAIPSSQKSSNEGMGESKNISLEPDDLMKLDSILTLLLAGMQQTQPSSPSNIVSDKLQTTNDTSSLQIEDKKKFDTYDWQKLGSVLTMLFAGLQQTQGLSPLSLTENLLKGERELSAVPNLVNNNAINLSNSSKTDSKLLQESSIHDTSQLMTELEKLIDKIQLVEKQSMLNQKSDPVSNIVLSQLSPKEHVPEFGQVNDNQQMLNLLDDIVKKVQVISGNINKNTDSMKLNSINNQVNTPTNNLSLDKNQLHLSFTPKQFENNRLVKNPIHVSSLNKDPAPPEDLVTRLQHLLQRPNGFNENNVNSENSPLTVSEFVPEVSEWIGSFMGSSNGQLKSDETKFSLFPEHLGHIEIKITSQQGQISAQIVTDTPAAKEALEGQLQHLKQAIQQHGIIVQKIDIIQQPVASSPGTLESNSANLSFSQGGYGSQGQQGSKFELETDGKQKDFDPNEMEIEALSTSYGGSQKPNSTIDFTA